MSESKFNSNLEFRKVKSLKFLYEINENGTILRNIKSKKQALIQKEDGRYITYIKNTPVEIQKLIKECWPDKNINTSSKSLVLINNQAKLEFDSISSAARYIAETQNHSFESVRQRIKKRKHAYGYDIAFPNAETRRAGSTEQGIVHLNQEEVI